MRKSTKSLAVALAALPFVVNVLPAQAQVAPAAAKAGNQIDPKIPMPQAPAVLRVDGIHPAPPPPAPLRIVQVPAAGPAPQPAIGDPLPADPKAAKKILKQRNRLRATYDAACFARSEVRPNMVATWLKSCDDALASPINPDDSWQRRARLLQQRAMILINRSDYSTALAALDESDAIGRDGKEQLFDNSIGMGNVILRAFAYQRSGKGDEAKALIKLLRERRPYAISMIKAADGLELNLVPSLETYAKNLEGRLRLDPDVLRSLLFVHLVTGNLERAEQVGEQVTLVDPRLRGGWTLNEAPSEKEDLETRVTFESTKAYIAALRGKPDRAQAFLDGARATVESYVGKDPRTLLDKKTPKPSHGAITKWETRRATGDEVLEIVSEWQESIKIRSELQGKTPEQVLQAMAGFRHKPMVLPALLDMMRTLSTGSGADSADAKRLYDNLTQAAFLRPTALNASELPQMLPRPEYLEQIDKFDSNALDWFWGGTNGYTQTKEKDITQDIRTVRYEAGNGTAAIAEEMLMMAIARYAEADGKDAFVILSNRTVGRTMTMYGYYGGGSTSDAGFESQARVLVFSQGDMPASLAGQENRIITVAEVKANIWPTYQVYAERKAVIVAAEKAARAKKN